MTEEQNPQPLAQPQIPPSPVGQETRPATSIVLPASSGNKRWLLFLLLGIVIGAVAATGVSLMLPMKKETKNIETYQATLPTQSPSPTPDPLKGWRVISSKFWTVKVPPSWKYIKCSDTVQFFGEMQSDQNGDCGFDGIPGEMVITKLPPVEFQKTYAALETSQNFQVSYKETITVDGNTALREQEVYPEGPGGGTFIKVYIPAKAIIITLDDLKQEEIFNSILSSITFVDGSKVTSLKEGEALYTDSLDNFTFIYPKTYVIEEKKEATERLLLIKKKDAPSFGYTLSISSNWENKGVENEQKNFSVGGVEAYRIDPPHKEVKSLERYQTNVYFEKNGKVFVFQCGHNWVPNYVATCDSILESFQFSK